MNSSATQLQTEEAIGLLAPPAGRSFRVEVSAGELLDKLTILQIKTERIRDAEKVRPAREELEMLQEVRRRELPASPRLDELLARLKAVNERLWDIEDELRQLEGKKEFGAAFIALARSVYRTNDERGALKGQINELVGSAYAEVKQYPKYR